MPLLRSSLVSSNDNFARDISSLHETFSNEIASAEKSSVSLTERNGYPDSIYLNAANIFQGIRNEKPQDKILVKYGSGPFPALPDFKDEQFQRLSYELAFSALKYQDVLEDILIDSGIYPIQSISDDLTSLVVVMLYDLQDRKFEARYIDEEEETIAEVQEVENHLYSLKTKLAAALARCRIKHDALSIEHILPETIRRQEQRASALPLYAWVNTLKTSLEEVHSSLKREGFTKVESVSNLDGCTYCLDTHCEDVLIFPSILKEQLLNSELFTNQKLSLQDKSRSLAVHSVKALLNMDDDILVAHMGSWLTLAHMSILTNQETSKVFVCGVKSVAKEAELKDLFARMECKNIEMLHEDFTDIEPTDHKLQKVKVILLLPRCSGLGVSNPIEFILKEHEDAELLRDLSQGSVAEEKLNVLAQQQLKELTHAMHFSKVQAVVYCTCSIYSEENEAVVNKALASGAEGAKAQLYKLSPPVLPLCCKSEITSADNFFKLEPSDISNSCFIAVLARERDPSESVSVKDVLARAAAKGLLEGIDFAKPPKREEKKKKKQKITQSKAATKEAVIQSRIQEFLDRELKPNNIDSDSSVSNIIASSSQTVNQTNGSIHLKKTTKPLSNSSLPVMAKNTPTSSSMQKVYERQRNIRKPKSEDKVMILKPVEIVLPPVMFPYFNPQGNKSQISANHYYYRWVGTKSGPYGLVSPSSSKKLIKSKEPSLSSAAKHPRPWL
ncbi:putative methyltransferase NSUN7 [Hemicordylus capensis]|uniref:putative methyltransferase NSUN7 n=1 Tax=Hemicordylus capensis TaxID=884348 RepID=UPI0023023F01|nr:putative methyltransferase NSUN7 [Hemicordylus capensis]XP_053112960.1 putative methyltransferase NSUN7 [Hemicordylus capensis]XP_053112962.1 putative methyltransferase NSUN7 [Hemicordylus capensis]XP_053112963.1 putative methyltransferase NSUN7 [Hemicordylus capensis]